jgi:hypothetical protein
VTQNLEVVVGAADILKLLTTLLGVVAELSSTAWRSSELLGWLLRDTFDNPACQGLSPTRVTLLLQECIRADESVVFCELGLQEREQLLQITVEHG